MSSTTSASPADGSRRKSLPWPLIALIVVCVAPLIAAYVSLDSWKPSRRMNYGDLIEPRPLPETRLTRPDGQPFHWSELKGRWVLIQLDDARCGEPCRRKLYQMRQVRLSQGAEMNRIERLWLLVGTDPVDPALLVDYAGTLTIRMQDASLISGFPAPEDGKNHIYLLDPLGNLMLRYPRDADPSRMKKDLERLLKVSQVG